MNNKLDLSIIIPTYKRKDVLIQTVSSLNGGSHIAQEIIVVDQNDDDVFLEELEKIDNVIIKKSCEPSLTRARNLGLSAASYDICLFCDDDILIKNNTLFDLYSMMCDKKTGLVAATDESSALVIPSYKKWISNVVSVAVGMKRLNERGGYVIKSTMRGRYNIGPNCTCHTDWAMGYFFAIKKSFSIAHDIYWDENMYSYAYAEDLDFSLRYCAKAKKEDMESVVTSKLGVTHLGSNEFRIPTDIQLFFLVANRYYLLHKNFPEIRLVRMRINNFFAGVILNEVKKIMEIDKFCRQHKELLFEGKIKEVENAFFKNQI